MAEPISIPIVESVSALREAIHGWRRVGLTVALVPTMGALHAGHLELVRMAMRLADRTCVSLFVNPTQFGPQEDFAVYPRDLAGDAKMLSELGAHLLFAPMIDEMYPPTSATRVSVPGLGDILEGSFRPGFFTGVATVVSKLFIQVMPDVAVFGEKDYQQLQVIRRMVADLFLPIRIEGVPTVREGDGLALSSRNAYLSAEERGIAPALQATLRRLAADAAAGADPSASAVEAANDLLAAGFRRVDYLEVRDAATLEPWAGPPRPGRVLAAAWLGRTRLIDNVPV
ncbi:MAG: pantoate--beta-alanine ligase [Rhodospirillales bacterium]